MRIALLLLATLCLATSVLAQEPGPWVTYTNARFGVSIQYPSGLFKASGEEPANGDGARFFSDNGAELSVWGAYNLFGETPYAVICGQRCEGETYRLARTTVAVSSGLREGRIYYEKCRVVRDRTNAQQFRCVRLNYDVAAKAAFDSVVKRIADSLR
jgi:hypothetical protein